MFINDLSTKTIRSSTLSNGHLIKHVIVYPIFNVITLNRIAFANIKKTGYGLFKTTESTWPTFFKFNLNV